MDLKNKIQLFCGWDGLQLPTMINSDQLFSKYETLLQRTIFLLLFRIEPQPIPQNYQMFL